MVGNWMAAGGWMTAGHWIAAGGWMTVGEPLGAWDIPTAGSEGTAAPSKLFHGSTGAALRPGVMAAAAVSSEAASWPSVPAFCSFSQLLWT